MIKAKNLKRFRFARCTQEALQNFFDFLGPQAVVRDARGDGWQNDEHTIVLRARAMDADVANANAYTFIRFLQQFVELRVEECEFRRSHGGVSLRMRWSATEVELHGKGDGA